jgi:ribosomal protein S18 acetylase RimI-like enzyme
MNFETKSASDYPLPDLVETVNRGFEGYFVPITLKLNDFLNMVRKDGIDLGISRVLLADGQPIGIALLAHRGWTSRLAAMGIGSEMRGRGAGSWFMDQLIDEACERGEHEMVLEVIEENKPAIHLYEKCGFEIVRRLISLVRKDANEHGTPQLTEIDIREVARLVSRHGLADLPWQLSAESLAQINPPARAYRNGEACIVISDPHVDHIVLWSLLVESQARGHGLGTQTLKAVIAKHPGKAWHIPALFPEELAKIFERAGFERESLSQWQMKLTL